MARKCQITGKKGSVGNKRSHACNATKREFRVNLVTKKFAGKKVKMAASTLRTLTKYLR